jgi:hypothetical protein
MTRLQPRKGWTEANAGTGLHAMRHLARHRLSTIGRESIPRPCPRPRARRPHHAFLVSQLLAHIESLEETIAAFTDQIATVGTPFADAVERLDTIPGIDRRNAECLSQSLVST